MKDFNDFVNYFNLDCQHQMHEAAHNIADSIANELNAASIDGKLAEEIVSTVTSISIRYSMLILRCYHQWLHELDL